MRILGTIASSKREVPGVPTIGTATNVGSGRAYNNGRADVTFTAPAITGGLPITSYTVTSSPGGFTATGASVFFDVVQTASTSTYVGCALNISTSTQSIATNTGTSILFDTEVIDTDGFHSPSVNTDRITIPSGKAGKYLVTAAITMAANSTGARVVNIAKNGSTAYGMTFPATATGASFGTITFIVDLAVSDYITASMFHTAGTNLNVQGVNTVGAGGTSLQATFIGV